jgi:hypothetical protein
VPRRPGAPRPRLALPGFSVFKATSPPWAPLRRQRRLHRTTAETARPTRPHPPLPVVLLRTRMPQPPFTAASLSPTGPSSPSLARSSRASVLGSVTTLVVPDEGHTGISRSSSSTVTRTESGSRSSSSGIAAVLSSPNPGRRLSPSNIDKEQSRHFRWLTKFAYTSNSIMRSASPSPPTIP